MTVLSQLCNFCLVYITLEYERNDEVDEHEVYEHYSSKCFILTLDKEAISDMTIVITDMGDTATSESYH